MEICFTVKSVVENERVSSQIIFANPNLLYLERLSLVIVYDEIRILEADNCVLSIGM